MESNTNNRSNKGGIAFKAAFRELMKSVNTAIPAYVLSFDPVNQRAIVQVAITVNNTEGDNFNWSPLVDVVVHFGGGGGFYFEHQIDEGDEGLVVFSQRCIDEWAEGGGIADQTELRLFARDDAFFIPGCRSKPNAIQSFENNGCRLRNESGDKFVWLKNDGTAAITVDTLNISGNIVHAGNLTQTGNATVMGTIESSISVTAPQVVGSTGVSAGGVEMTGHVHAAGTPPGDTGVAK